MRDETVFLFKARDMSVEFGVSLSYTKGKENIVVNRVSFMEAASDNNILSFVYKDKNIELLRYIKQCEEKRLVTWLTLKNISKDDIFLESITVFDAAGSLNIKNADSRELMFLRHGRHKNDLPSVCTVGKKDASFSDAVTGMLESGKRVDNDAFFNKLISDQLTLIKAPHDDAALILGFDTGIGQLVETKLETDGNSRVISLTSTCLFDINLPANCTVETEKLRIEFTENIRESISSYASDKAALYAARKGKTPPSVFCTWYYYGQTVTEEDVYENLTVLREQKLPFDVYQIDDGWAKAPGEWENNEKFPAGMKKIADDIAQAGYRPGIWTCPFIAHESSQIVREHPEWFLYGENGNYCPFNMGGTAYYVLDITNPSVLDWIEDLYRLITKEWGYTYHKLDFTRAPVIQEKPVFYNKNITLAQAYRKAVERIRRGIGDDSYLLMCGGLYDPIIGLVDAQRTSSDVLSMWEDSLGTGGKTIPFTVKQNCFRYFMNNWWDNDPDALMVRRNPTKKRDLNLTYGLLSDAEAQTMTLNQYIGGGLVCSTEPLKTIDKDRLLLLRHIIPVVKTKPTAIDMFSGERYVSIIDIEVNNNSYHTIALINWSDTDEQGFSLCLDERLLGNYANRNDAYVASTFYGKKLQDGLKYGSIIEIPGICPHGCEIVKIQAKRKNLPAVVFSDAHFSMGAEIDVLEIKDSILHIKLNNLFECPLNYTVMLPEGRVPCGLYGNMEFTNGLLCVSIPHKGMFEYAIEVGEAVQ